MVAGKQEFQDVVESVALLDGERISNIGSLDPGEKVEMSAEQALMKLCGVDSLEAVGTNGPINAATSFSSSADSHLQLFETLFGRDSLIVGLFLAEEYPELLKVTVTRLAELQGVETRPSAEEEPGRIIHEYRTDDDPKREAITEKRGWGWPYFGSIDATPLFILAMKQLHKMELLNLETVVTQRNGEQLSLQVCLEKAALWILHNLEKSSLGLMETHRSFDTSIHNQTWKDSFDSMHFSDGVLCEGAVSSVEVQAQTYDALKFAEQTVTDVQLASQIAKAKQNLLESFSVHYISNGDVMVAQGVGYRAGQPEALNILGSNIGHLLNTDLLLDLKDRQLEQWIIDSLFCTELLAGAGVRSLGTSEVRFRPGAYHNGNVWLWESALFAKKLNEIGRKLEAAELARRVTDACHKFGGFPEFARGSNDLAFNQFVIDIVDIDGKPNRIEQPPQQVQAWTVAGYLYLESAGLVASKQIDLTVVTDLQLKPNSQTV